MAFTTIVWLRVFEVIEMTHIVNIILFVCLYLQRTRPADLDGPGAAKKRVVRQEVCHLCYIQ